MCGAARTGDHVRMTVFSSVGRPRCFPSAAGTRGGRGCAHWGHPCRAAAPGVRAASGDASSRLGSCARVRAPGSGQRLAPVCPGPPGRTHTGRSSRGGRLPCMRGRVISREKSLSRGLPYSCGRDNGRGDRVVPPPAGAPTVRANERSPRCSGPARSGSSRASPAGGRSRLRHASCAILRDIRFGRRTDTDAQVLAEALQMI